MKLLVGAIALAFAMPAAAQTASAQVDHSHHRQVVPAHNDHVGHQRPPGGSHEGHAMKGDGCCADKDGNGKMDCCEKMAAKKDDQPSDKALGQ